jgi:hypothetical protein
MVAGVGSVILAAGWEVGMGGMVDESRGSKACPL